MNTHAHSFVLVRWFTIPPIALLVTLALLLLMHLLIFVETPDIPVDVPTPMPKIVMDTVEPIKVIDNKPTKVDDPIAPPPIVEPQVDPVPGGGDTVHITYDPPPAGPTKINLGGQLVAHFKVQPNYPARAANRGIEGYVIVEFDVTEMGTTDNIRVVAAEPQNMFDGSVIQAVQRWKYNPKLVNGEPVRSYSLRERISFTMD